MLTRRRITPDQDARLEAQWQQVQAAHASARAAAEQATRQALHEPAMWTQQLGHALAWLAGLTAAYYGLATAAMLGLALCFPGIRGAGQPVLDLARMFAGFGLMIWLPFFGLPAIIRSSPFSKIWKRAYDAAWKRAWESPV